METQLPNAAGIEDLNRSVTDLVRTGDGKRLLRLFRPNQPMFFLLEPQLVGAVRHLVSRATGFRFLGHDPNTHLADLVNLSPAQLGRHLEDLGYGPVDAYVLVTQRAALRTQLPTRRLSSDPSDSWETWGTTHAVASPPVSALKPLPPGARQILLLLRARDRVPAVLPMSPRRTEAAWRKKRDQVPVDMLPYREARDILLDKHRVRCGLRGASVGHRQVRGTRTDEMCVIAFVERKRHRWSLTRDRFVPRCIDYDGHRIPIDVRSETLSSWHFL